MKKYLFILIAVFVLIQVGLIVRLGGVPQVSDAKYYLDIADSTIAAGAWYPAPKDANAYYIWAPGYINLLIAVKKVCGAVLPCLLYINILFNLILLFEMWYMAKKMFSVRTANIAAVAYCLYLNNYGIILYVFTEQLFCCLAYGSLCCVIASLQRGGLKVLQPDAVNERGNWFAAPGLLCVFGGILLGAAHTVRPMTVPFIAGALLYAVSGRRAVLKTTATYVVSFIVTVAAVGLLNYARMGYFVTTSTTGGLNFVIGANDAADGQWDNTVFKKGHMGYIGKGIAHTFRERDDYMMKKAVDWVRHNPGRYAALLPKKLYYMFGYDSFCERVFSGDREGLVAPKNGVHKALYSRVLGYAWVYYCVLLALGALGIGFAVKNKVTAGYALVAVMVFGTLMTILVAYGMDRYKYPYMVIIIIFAAYALDRLGSKLGR